MLSLRSNFAVRIGDGFFPIADEFFSHYGLLLTQHLDNKLFTRC